MNRDYERLVRFTARGMVSLKGIGQLDQYYLVEVDPDGVITLTPVVVVPASEVPPTVK